MQRWSSKSLPSGFYIIRSSTRGDTGPGIEIVNEYNLQKNRGGITAQPPWPDGVYNLPNHPYRRPEYIETPQILFDRKKGHFPRDLESQDGMWIISPTMKAVLQAVDPEACAFMACETFLPSGQSSRETWLCTVTRAFKGGDVVDIDATFDFRTRLRIEPIEGAKRHFHFIPAAIGSAHLFRLAEYASTVFCDQIVKDACKAANLTGVEFLDVPDKKARPPEWHVAQARRRLAKLSSETDGYSWESAQMVLALTLESLGRTEETTKALEEAAAAFRELIAWHEAQRLRPADSLNYRAWLARVLVTIGIKKGEASFLREAGTIFQQLLAFSDFPDIWISKKTWHEQALKGLEDVAMALKELPGTAQ